MGFSCGKLFNQARSLIYIQRILYIGTINVKYYYEAKCQNESSGRWEEIKVSKSIEIDRWRF